ncbi:cysteine-rich CWC family protein [Aliivibrio sp.]|uniref:cysteine-rich CWC family protein n=1 Tax=Aliivibrio sp. TaxID=1872443 RepID=UPI003D2F3CF1
MTIPIDETRCPICHQSNRCMANRDKPCWCASNEIPKELIEQVPEALINRSCICLTCVKAYKANST